MSKQVAKGPPFLAHIRHATSIGINLDPGTAITVYPTPSGKTHTRNGCPKRRTQRPGTSVTLHELMTVPASVWCSHCQEGTPDELHATNSALAVIFEAHKHLRRNRNIELLETLHLDEARLTNMYSFNTSILAHREKLSALIRRACGECVAGIDHDAERRYAAVVSMPNQTWRYVTGPDGIVRSESFLSEPILPSSTDRWSFGPHKAYVTAWAVFKQAIANGSTYETATVKAVSGARHHICGPVSDASDKVGTRRELVARVSVEIEGLVARWVESAEANAAKPVVTVFVSPGYSRAVRELCTRLLAPYSPEPATRSNRHEWYVNVPGMIVDALNTHLDDNAPSNSKQAWVLHDDVSDVSVLRTAAALYDPNMPTAHRTAFEHAFEAATLLN